MLGFKHRRPHGFAATELSPTGAGQLSSNQPGLICQIVNIFSSAQSLNLTLNKRAFIEEWLCLRNFNRFTIHFELVVKTSAY